jgi:phosphoribosylformylglycinamidine cyclo-ligase
MRYADFVDYSTLDPFKERIVEALGPTWTNINPLGIRLIPESLGQPAVLLDFLNYDFALAFKNDCVGTKGYIADKMVAEGWDGDVASLYSGLGVDVVANNANDIICMGATPIALSDEIGSGRSEWFADEARVTGLLEGLRRGCDETGITIPCGETPTLPDVVNPQTSYITGSMIGIVRPKERACWGQDLQEGDVIFGLPSSGLHSNGLTLGRRIVERWPQGYFTVFGDWTVGQELLTPTKTYVAPVLEAGVEMHYLSNITGSGWRKVMRCRYPFTYVLESLPEPPHIFRVLQQEGGISDHEAYQTWNMGVGFCLYAPARESAAISAICADHGMSVVQMGHVEKGERRVVIDELQVAYTSEW